MIRLAGAKNDGAWFRTNQAIKRFRANGGADAVNVLSSVIDGADGFGDYVDALNNIATYYGVALTNPIAQGDLASNWAQTGIPREVWLGVPRMTVYDKVVIPNTTPPKYRYVDRYQAAFRTFAINLRYKMRQWIKAQTFLEDVQNVQPATSGNPGGIADANKAT